MFRYIANMVKVIVLVTPTAIANAGWKFYLVFCIMNALSIPFVWFCLPEVRSILSQSDEPASDAMQLDKR